jgi:hypothetical protein
VPPRFSAITPGRKLLTVYRIDSTRRWSEREIELLPLRAPRGLHLRQLLLPAAPVPSVALVCLDEITQRRPESAIT